MLTVQRRQNMDFPYVDFLALRKIVRDGTILGKSMYISFKSIRWLCAIVSNSSKAHKKLPVYGRWLIM